MAPQTLFSLPPSTVLPAGPTTTSNFTFPAGISSVRVQFAMAAADLTDPTKQMTVELWRFNGTAFVLDASFSWQGNSKDDSGIVSQPFIEVSVGPLAGAQCQVRLSLNKSLTTGITVTSN